MYRSYLLIVSCLLCFSGFILASPSLNSLEKHNADLIEGNPDARSGPSNSDHDHRRRRPHSTHVSRRRKREDWPPECADLNDHYSTRDLVADKIDTFCKDVNMQGGRKDKDSGAITRRYYEGTNEEVRFAIDIFDNFKVDKDECKRRFKMLVDDCSPPVGNNYHNVKAGGINKTPTAHYRLEPIAKRSRPENAYSGRCICTNKGFYNSCNIAGAGWGIVDKAAGVKDELDDCLPWKRREPKFESEDDSEWYINDYQTAIGQKSCVQKALWEAGGPGDLKCSGDAW